MPKRYRLKMGETHEDVGIADDEKRVYLHGDQVDLLNEYDIKNKVMLAKLEELGYKLIFVKEDYNMSSKKFETIYTTNPSVNDTGKWLVVTLDEYNKYVKRGDDNIGEK